MVFGKVNKRWPKGYFEVQKRIIILGQFSITLFLWIKNQYGTGGVPAFSDVFCIIEGKVDN